VRGRKTFLQSCHARKEPSLPSLKKPNKRETKKDQSSGGFLARRPSLRRAFLRSMSRQDRHKKTIKKSPTNSLGETPIIARSKRVSRPKKELKEECESRGGMHYLASPDGLKNARNHSFGKKDEFRSSPPGTEAAQEGNRNRVKKGARCKSRKKKSLKGNIRYLTSKGGPRAQEKRYHRKEATADYKKKKWPPSLQGERTTMSKITSQKTTQVRCKEKGDQNTDLDFAPPKSAENKKNRGVRRKQASQRRGPHETRDPMSREKKSPG